MSFELYIRSILPGKKSFKQVGVNTMPKEINKLAAEALGLDMPGRAQLADKLLLSLDAPTDGENAALRVQEAERRLKAL